MSASSEKACMESALRLLGGRDHSRRELADKLRQRGYAAPDIAVVTAECLRLDYLNDEKFARLYLQQLRRKGYGQFRIRHMLQVKGLGAQLIEDLLASDCDVAAQSADCRRALAKKLSKTEYDRNLPDLKVRLHRFLLNRGFPADIVRKTLQQALPVE